MPVVLADTQNDARYDLAYLWDVIDTSLAFGAIPFISIDAMPFALSANRIPNHTDCTTSFMNAVSNHWPADNNVKSEFVYALEIKAV